MKADWQDRKDPTTLVLFDVDGTLTPSRLKAKTETLELLRRLKEKVVIGFVGGSDLNKQFEQLGKNCLELFDFGFSENGLVAYRRGRPLPSESFIKWLGDKEYNKLVNFCLRYIADLDIEKKRGTFVEFRRGMINVSPIGRNCSQDERIEFFEVDKSAKIRARFVEALKNEFSGLGLKFSIGGQISFDVFPEGWDKTFCLRHIEEEGFKTVHFFGDRTAPGGNDYEIFSDPRTVGHSVKAPEETETLLKELFNL